MNNNIISTSQNIKGDISTCETRTVDFVSSRESFWVENKTTVTTNNCTGVSKEYVTWNITPDAVLATFFALLFVAVMIGAVISTLATENEERDF